MYARVVWGKIRKDRWEDYRKFYIDRVVPTTQGMKGFRSRLLLRGMEDPDEGIAISFWDNWEDLDAYDKSEVRQSSASAARYLYAGEYGMEHFNVDYSSEGFLTESANGE
ncbi:MAG: hypothetical protein O7E55_01780 [Chloroflexi bacterium]|nr:hypothetical protein [Chloroflexota bacterium]